MLFPSLLNKPANELPGDVLLAFVVLVVLLRVSPSKISNLVTFDIPSS